MKKLFNLFKRKQNKKMYLILQWGKERSIIEDINTYTQYIVDNQYIATLSERGNIYE